MGAQAYRGGKHAASRSVQSASESRYVAPPKDECEQRTITVDLADGHARITQRLVYYKGTRLVYFAIIFSVKKRGRWVQQCYVDTGHGCLHIHHDAVRGHENSHELMPLRTEREVRESFETGYNAIHNRYLAWQSERGT